MRSTSDVLIIGGGPAGLTAALYALRAGLTAVVFDGGFTGGQAAITQEIENYPAILRISGPDFSARLTEQAVSQGADIRQEEVLAVELAAPVKRVRTAEGEYEGRTVILANGVKRRRLQCPGEEELAGKGVSYCATCDGAFFKDKEVALVGGGNTALEDALFLANHCRRVTVIHRRDTFRAQKPLIEALEKRDNVRVLYRSTVAAIEGSGKVEAVSLQTPEGELRLPVAGVFIAIGYEADNGFVRGQLALDENGYIAADESCLTEVEGVYAAGDNRAKPLRQIVTAAADGAVAAFQAANYINTHPLS